MDALSRWINRLPTWAWRIDEHGNHVLDLVRYMPELDPIPTPLLERLRMTDEERRALLDEYALSLGRRLIAVGYVDAHILTLKRNDTGSVDFGLQHPIECRSHLIDCEIHRLVMDTEPNNPDGQYTVTVSHDQQDETYLVLEPLPDSQVVEP